MTPFKDAIGKNVLLLGINYIYYGRLVAEHPTHVEVEDCHIIYETGAWEQSHEQPDWKDAQLLPKHLQPFHVSKSAFEAWGVDNASSE